MGCTFGQVVLGRVAVLAILAAALASPAVAATQARKDAADNVAKAEIETAMAMNDAQLATLKASLARHFGKTIEAEVRVNPALIGGVRITVGDRVIDGSVQGKLTTMANELSA